MWARYLPYMGWPLFVLLFFLWLDGRENLAAQVELCNVDKLQAVAIAEQAVREALSVAHAREMAEAEARLKREQGARLSAEVAKNAAERAASDAQNTIRKLMREATGNEDIQPETACLVVDVPSDILSGLR